MDHETTGILRRDKPDTNVSYNGFEQSQVVYLQTAKTWANAGVDFR